MRLIPPAADLHIHTVYSDGKDTVSELFEAASEGLAIISIADHDTLEAYQNLPTAPDGLRLLPGVELSCRLGEDSGLHLLGYFPGGFTSGFESFVEELAEDRNRRVREGVRRLRDLGLGLRWSAIDAQAGEMGVLCRSHVCRALVDMGVGRNPQSIFRKYLFDNFDPPPVEAREAIEVVRREGGYPVWAHPHPNAVDRYGDDLRDAGLAGLEAFIPRRRRGHCRRLCEWAEERGLFTTGGSDHHGVDPKRPLGTWRLDMDRVPPQLREPSY